MVSFDPGLRTSAALRRDQKDDVLRPQRPAFEVAGQSQSKGHAALVELILHVPPCCNEHDCLRCVSSRSMEDSVHVLAGVGDTSGRILILLGRDF